MTKRSVILYYYYFHCKIYESRLYWLLYTNTVLLLFKIIESAMEKGRNGIFKLNPRHLDSIKRMEELKDKSRKHEVKSYAYRMDLQTAFLVFLNDFMIEKI